ncbi:MAG: PQQ-binding-like beta-propeller repeat protein [Pyrinomonadaceae bacterium]
MKTAFLFSCLLALALNSIAQTAWKADLDSRVRFYDTTDFGIVLAGTDKSLYALDGRTGERIWRRSTGKVGETAVTQVPNTDIVLFTRDLGSRSRLEAVDVLTGTRIWQSDKVKGDVMQLALDPELDVLAVVLAKDARGKAGENIKRKPTIHVLQLSTGDELWKRDLDGDIEMMPSRFDSDADVDFTLENYRAPLILDGRLWLFYEGSTSYDTRTGKEKEREKFKINESGLALTEADPVWDDEHIFVSGRGQIRSIDRRSGREDWKASDVGNCAEMVLVNEILYVRTGGRFTRLNDGELEDKGPFGVAAIDAVSGKTLWRYKGADKGLTNFAFVDPGTVVVADRDELITIDAGTGKRVTSRRHKIADAQFVVVNESGQAVVGGKNELAAFSPRTAKEPEFWRVRHTPPGRGLLRTVAGIGLRAAAIYFRYGGFATSALGIVRGGASLASAANSFRVSGLRSHLGSIDLSSLASDTARGFVTRRLYSYGSLTRDTSLASKLSGLDVTPGSLASRAAASVAPSRDDLQESILDRLDPARQMDRLSDFLLRRRRLAELRSNTMYFYTDLPRGGHGLIGTNVHTGRDERFVNVGDPDPRFVVDDQAGLLYSADGDKLRAYPVR